MKKASLILFTLALTMGIRAQTLDVMTYNIRYDNPGDVPNNWDNRKEFLISQLRFYAPDVFGTQEGLVHQLKDIDRGLEAYAYFGVGRDHGDDRGEFTAIFYNTNKLDLLEESTFWLSPTPEAEAAIDARARRAASEAVRRLLSPRSVAVIGASRTSGTIGRDLFQNLQRAGFEGPIWPVNPEAQHIGSTRAVPSILDIPDEVLGQLGNRIQHALRAYTPREQKAVRAAAETFRANPDFSTEEVITELGTGEALVSTLEDKGVPSVVGRTMMRPPSSRLGPILPDERRKLMAGSPVAGLYDKTVDRESAFEVLAAKVARRQEEELDRQEEVAVSRERPAARRSTRQTPVEAAITSFTRSVASRLGTALVRGILGGLTRGR